MNDSIVHLKDPPYKIDRSTMRAMVDKLEVTFSYRVESTGHYPEVVPIPFTYNYGDGYDSLEDAFSDKIEKINPLDTVDSISRRIKSDMLMGVCSELLLNGNSSVLIWASPPNKPEMTKYKNFWTLAYSYPFKLDSGEVVTKYIIHPQINIMAYWHPKTKEIS